MKASQDEPKNKQLISIKTESSTVCLGQYINLLNREAPFPIKFTFSLQLTGWD